MNPAHPVIPGRLPGYCGRLTDDVAAACGGRLRAAYLHGSGALGGWIAGRSDVDLLFVAADDVAGQPLGAVGEVLAAAGSGARAVT
jgi:tRNA nucleotidyltransferase (CCA-adding enzyme)